jgi:hypothetical protein
MVTVKTFERLMNNCEEIAQKAGTDPDVAEKVLQVAQDEVISRRRQPKVPIPEGGISINIAARKYKVDHTLLCRWRKKGIIITLLETKNEIYVSEESVSKAVAVYKEDPGRGKRTVIKAFVRKSPSLYIP